VSHAQQKARAPLIKTLKRERARFLSARMTPEQRSQRLIAVIKTWRSICTRRGLSRAQKDEIFEQYLINHYGLGATARRDYRKIVETAKLKKGL